MKHFEQLWEDAEKSSAKHSLSKEEILANLRKLLEAFSDIERQQATAPTGYTQAARLKAMGDILLSLANISAMDSIDVYKSLHEAIQRSDIRALKFNENNTS